MKQFKLTALFAVVLVGIAGCNKREIIPAPTVEIELESSFIGKIGGSTIEFTQNVGGYSGSSAPDLIIDAGAIDKAVYNATMSSNNDSRSITVGHGSLFFDSNASSVPGKAEFNAFFSNSTNLQPDFSLNGTAGFRVKFRDASGRVWASNENGSYPLENVVYTNVRQESDNTGDYSSFRVDFATYVYRNWSDGTNTYVDSLLITDAVYKGWYKR
jgi:hypothetical protein